MTATPKKGLLPALGFTAIMALQAACASTQLIGEGLEHIAARTILKLHITPQTYGYESSEYEALYEILKDGQERDIAAMVDTNPFYHTNIQVDSNGDASLILGGDKYMATCIDPLSFNNQLSPEDIKTSNETLVSSNPAIKRAYEDAVHQKIVAEK